MITKDIKEMKFSDWANLQASIAYKTYQYLFNGQPKHIDIDNAIDQIFKSLANNTMLGYYIQHGYNINPTSVRIVIKQLLKGVIYAKGNSMSTLQIDPIFDQAAKCYTASAESIDKKVTVDSCDCDEIGVL